MWVDTRNFRLEVEDYDDQVSAGVEPWYTVKKISIIDTSDRRQVGFAVISYSTQQPTTVRGGRLHLLKSADGFGNEFIALIRAVFDSNGRILYRFSSDHNRLWGSEVKFDKFALLEHLEIHEGYRNWGAGTWFLECVWSSNAFPQVPKAPFLFVRPEPLYGPHRSDPVTGKLLAGDRHLYLWKAVKHRLFNFYRRVGFRQVGTTVFLCLARDPNHPSRSYPMEWDSAGGH
ncbi:hypothetical protein RQP46_005686 [Phenoliferia psychrophenolica]